MKMFIKRFLLHLIFIISITFPTIVKAEEAAAPAVSDSAQTSDSSTELKSDSSESPTFKEKKDKEGYVLNLKDLIKESKKKIEKVNDKLKDQARQRRNQQREEKAREYYEKAMHLFDEGRLEEAQELWNKSIKITEHPEMKDYIGESVKKTKKQEDLLKKEEYRQVKELEVERGYSAKEVEAAYQRAVDLYKKQKYLDAKDEFDRVENMFPDHKATRSYLMVIDQEIQKEQQKLIDAQLENKVASKRQEKEEWRRSLEEKERQQQLTLEEQAEAAYRDAVKLYKNRQFEQAKDKFREVEWILPNYKSTVQYLSRIDRDIKEEEKRLSLDTSRQRDQELDERIDDEKQIKDLKKKERVIKSQEEVNRLKDEADFVYESAMNLYKKQNYSEALEKFEEVDQLYPNYKKTQKYISELNKLLKIEEEKVNKKQLAQFEKELQDAKRAVNEEQMRQAKRNSSMSDIDRAKVMDEAEVLYSSGVSLFKSNLYKQARDKFIEVDKIQPNYKLTDRYLSRLERLIKEPVAPTENESVGLVNNGAKLSAEEQVLQAAITERQEKLQKEAEDKYKQAVNFYKSGNYVEAKLKFIQVEALSPDYKDVGDYLQNIDQDIAKMRGQKKINRNIKMVEASHKDTKSKKETAARVKPELQESDIISDFQFKSPSDEDNERLANMYAQALNLFHSKLYESAAETLRDISQIDPNYRSTQSLLKRAEQQVKRQNRISPKQKQEEIESAVLKKQNLPPVNSANTDLKTAGKTNYNIEAIAKIKAKEEFLEETKKREYAEIQKNFHQERTVLENTAKGRRGNERKLIEDLKKKMYAEEKARKKVELERKKSEEKALMLRIKEPIPQVANQSVVPSNELSKEEVKVENNIVGEDQERAKRLKKLEKVRNNKKKPQAIDKVVVSQGITWTTVPDNPNAQNQEQVLNKSEESSNQNLNEISDDMLDEASSKQINNKTEETVSVPKKDPQLGKKIGKARQRLDRIRSIENHSLSYQKREILNQSKKIKQQLAKKQQEEQKRLGREVSRMYDYAVKLYHDGQYSSAQREFISIKSIQPDYKLTEDYISKINQKVQVPRSKKQLESNVNQMNRASENVKAEKDNQNEIINQNEADNTKVISTGKEPSLEKTKKEKVKEERLQKQKAKEEKVKVEKLKQEKAKEVKVNKQKSKKEIIKESSEDVPVEKLVTQKTKSKEKIEGIVIKEDANQAIKEKLKKENAELKNNLYREELSLKKQSEDLELQKLREERLALVEKESLIKRSKAEAFKNAREDKLRLERQKREEEQKIRLENLRKTKLKEQEDRQRQNQELARMKTEIDKTYQDAIKLYKLNKIELSREKFRKLDQLLNANNQLPVSYREKMHQKSEQTRSQLEILFEKEREKNEKIAKANSARADEKEIKLESKGGVKQISEVKPNNKENSKVTAKESVQNVDDIEQLRKKIEIEDQKIAKEKEAEELRMKKLEEKKKAEEKAQMDKSVEDSSNLAKDVVNSKSVKPSESDTAGDLKNAEEEKRRELDQLVKRRQQDLRAERERIVQELNESVEHLYDKAVRLYDSGYYDEAQGLLNEVQDLKPGYKRTTMYLTKILEESKKSSASDNSKKKAAENKTVQKSKKNKSRQDLISEALNSMEVQGN